MTNCKRLKFQDGERVSILLGLVEKDDGQFLTFRTARRSVLVNKSYLISLEDTSEVFREAER